MNQSRLFVLGLLFALASYCASAQTKSLRERLEESALEPQEKESSRMIQPGPVPLESTVDPSLYTVGPSDGLAFIIWTTPPLNTMLTVTPEGSLLLPTVGEVHVDGLTLREAKERILAEVRKRYRGVEVTVTLVTPRPILVNVVGFVLTPGMYALTAADRAGRAVALANEIPANLRGQLAPPPEEETSLRNVVVRHRDGTEHRVDLQIYLATKDDRRNPFLREGDVVIVPRRDPVRNVVGIYGAVNTPGRFEYVRGDSILDLLHLGQGFTAHARVDSVLFGRLTPDGREMQRRVIDLVAIASRTAPNFALETGDRIIVPARMDLRQDYRVTIMGQVKNPGTYPITGGGTRLSEAIQLAGGFTADASLRSAELIRSSIGAGAVELEKLESARGGIAQEDSAYYLLESQLRMRKEVVAVDFEQLFAHKDTTQDVLVQSEDYINVPSLRTTVYVFGQVFSNGHVEFVAGEPVEYYIRKAGGFTDRAREGDVRIVKAKTRQWLAPKETTVEPGDYIWVPKEYERPFGYWMNIIGQTASIVGVAVSVVLLTIQLSN